MLTSCSDVLMMPKLQLWPVDVALISSPPSFPNVYLPFQHVASEQKQNLERMCFLIIFAVEVHLCVSSVYVFQSGAKLSISTQFDKLVVQDRPPSLKEALQK